MTTFFAKGEWHAPTIVDLGIRVSRKNNTWPTFFKMIKQHPTCRVYPDVKISSKKQVDGKLRARISIAADADDGAAREAALADPNVRKFVGVSAVRKVVVVPGKLVNVVV